MTNSTPSLASSSHINLPQITLMYRLTLEERFKLCLTIGEECISEADLKDRLEKKAFPVCYDGFEPSGRMHIAQVYIYPQKF